MRILSQERGRLRGICPFPRGKKTQGSTGVKPAGPKPAAGGQADLKGDQPRTGPVSANPQPPGDGTVPLKLNQGNIPASEHIMAAEAGPNVGIAGDIRKTQAKTPESVIPSTTQSAGSVSTSAPVLTAQVGKGVSNQPSKMQPLSESETVSSWHNVQNTDPRMISPETNAGSVHKEIIVVGSGQGVVCTQDEAGGLSMATKSPASQQPINASEQQITAPRQIKQDVSQDTKSQPDVMLSDRSQNIPAPQTTMESEDISDFEAKLKREMPSGGDIGNIDGLLTVVSDNEGGSNTQHTISDSGIDMWTSDGITSGDESEVDLKPKSALKELYTGPMIGGQVVGMNNHNNSDVTVMTVTDSDTVGVASSGAPIPVTVDEHPDDLRPDEDQPCAESGSATAAVTEQHGNWQDRDEGHTCKDENKTSLSDHKTLEEGFLLPDGSGPGSATVAGSELGGVKQPNNSTWHVAGDGCPEPTPPDIPANVLLQTHHTQSINDNQDSSKTISCVNEDNTPIIKEESGPEGILNEENKVRPAIEGNVRPPGDESGLLTVTTCVTDPLTRKTVKRKKKKVPTATLR